MPECSYFVLMKSSDLAGGRAKNAKAIIQFATERKVATADVLTAMQTAASDFTVGDMVAARFADVIRFTKPPRVVQRLLFGVLRAIGHARG